MDLHAVEKSVPPSSPGPSEGCRVAVRNIGDMRRAISRFAERCADLPVATRATCPGCGALVDGTFLKHGEQVILEYRCGSCGTLREVHDDAIWTERASDVEGSPRKTYGGSRIHPVLRQLPRTVETLCPECCAVIVGRYFIEGREVFIEKTCPEHGYCRDKISADALIFSKASWWSFEEHRGQKYPQVTGASRCPADCGLCNQHLSSPCLAQIDVTNRCNMNCPVCFAGANSPGYVCELSYDQIVDRMKALRGLRPHPCTAVQLTGGEPTIHPDFLRIVSTAGQLGFSHIQIATNGIRLADEDFAKQSAAAGLHTLYLQFDGVGEDAYRESRNYPGIWAKKLAAIENARKTGMKVCLVPTLIKGVTDDQVVPILQFAVDNVDVVSGISWQPVSFTGRMSIEDRQRQRYTLGDLARDLGQWEGVEPLRDLFPLSLVVPLSNLLEAITGEPKIRASAHPDCAMGTYFLVSPEGKTYTFPSVIDVEGMFSDMNRLARDITSRGTPAGLRDKIRLVGILKRHWKKDAAPPGLDVKLFYRSLLGMVDKSIGRGKSGQRNYRTLLCAGMHFQDRYNFDVERVKRCVILYATPEGIFPFCTHNCGPEYRYLTQGLHAARGEGEEERRLPADGGDRK